MNDSKRRRPGEHDSPVLKDLPAACKDEAAAVDLFEQMRWPNGPACLGCGSVAVYKMTDRKTGQRNRRFLWRCRERECGRQFTARLGTVLEDSRIPVRIWLHALARACASKKGVSALQLSRECAVSYKSSLFLLNRIRFGPTFPTTPT